MTFTPPVSSLSRRALMMATAAATGLTLTGCQLPKTKTTASTKGWDDTLADLHKRTFQWFWDVTPPKTGLTPDNWPNPDFCSVAAVGFALNACCIGAHSGYVTRAQAAERTLTTLRTFWNGPQGPERAGVMGYKGFFYHFLNMGTGLRHDTVELSSIDTALFITGALTAAAFFDGDNDAEKEIRKLGVALYERVDWTFLERDNGLISMGYHPEPGLNGHDATGRIIRSWDRYNEGMMVYHLAMASKTHPIKATAWDTWAATIGVTWADNFGEPHLGFAPLFGHQYSHVWYDYRGIADAYMRGKNIDYFINSQRATVAQRNYAIKNPGGFKDYSGDVWGLTACRGPAYTKGKVDGREVQFFEYSARGPQTGDKEANDDGTIAPTAGISSVAFSPEICLPLIHTLREKYGSDLYGEYGFYDAFNPSFPKDLPSRVGHQTPKAGWVAYEYLAIDQGPILSMLENHRSGLIWDLFNRSPVTGPMVRRGFQLAGFQSTGPAGDWLKAKP
ncbi:glucoamylase family protein [Asticcacaulis sp. AC460]|uniref:glucoamylase family protein n=1 Tax=Asticcacaulis sp. AC460 TaxID=1282360 RepID=UPI0004100302|nr:glucoamylase family protein [Asticcacaulis sp. AC460]